MEPPQPSERLQGVGHLVERKGRGHLGAGVPDLHHRAGRSARRDVGEEGVGVEALAPERDEERAPGQRP